MASVKWLIDPTHSEVSFKVKHLMITTVTGHFKKFNLEVDTENDEFQTASRIEFTADIDSIDTNNEQRDAHLKTADFFNSEENKHLTFSGNKYESSGSEAKIYGNLTIHGITKPAVLDVEYGGTVVDPYGQTKAGFTVTTKISRKEYGLTWSAITEGGGIVVSDEVKINAEVQLIRQAG